jgi:hypothetical protein
MDEYGFAARVVQLELHCGSMSQWAMAIQQAVGGRSSNGGAQSASPEPQVSAVAFPALLAVQQQQQQ